MTGPRDCSHGQLRRSCEMCEMRADYDALLAAARAYVAEQEGLPPCASCGFWNGRHGDGCKLRALAELVGEERRE